MALFSTASHMRGGSLVEVLVGASIIALVLVSSVSTLELYSVSSRVNLERVEAAYLLEGGLEGVRFMRDGGWSSNITPLSEAVPYYLVFSGGAWQATTTEVLFNNRFHRTVTFHPVYRRDSDDDIVASSSAEAKTLDPDTKRVVVEIAWSVQNTVGLSFEEGTTSGDLANFPSNGSGDGDPAQSFTVSGEELLASEAELLLQRAAGTSPSDVFLEIRSGTTVGPVVATSGIVDISALSDTSFSWVSFSFPSAPTLASSTSYVLRLRSVPDSTEIFSGSSGTLLWAYEQSAGSPYGGGDAFRYVGRQGNASDPGQPLDQYDFSFKILTQTTGQSIEAVTYLTNLFDN